MCHIYGMHTSWAQEGFTFTWGNLAAIHGASNQKFGYADLGMSHGDDAKEEGNLSQALLLVLCKGPIHKDRHNKDDQVAVWQHKEDKLCSVFSTAAHILTSLQSDNTANFFHLDKCKHASWWDEEIFASNNKDGEYNSDGLLACASISNIHCCVASAHKKKKGCKINIYTTSGGVMNSKFVTTVQLHYNMGASNHWALIKSTHLQNTKLKNSCLPMVQWQKGRLCKSWPVSKMVSNTIWNVAKSLSPMPLGCTKICCLGRQI
jgi:hypothetical protein